MIPRPICHLLEALLFTSGDPLPEKDLRELITSFSSDDEGFEFHEFVDWYNNRPGGLKIVSVAGGLQLVTRAEFADSIKELNTQYRKVRFSRAALETLAIIAYRQPVTAPEIENVRGVDSSGVLRNLLEKKLVAILGKRKGPGNPILYGTTNQFLITFGLDDLESLPALEEFQDLLPESAKNLEIPFTVNTETGNNEHSDIDMNGKNGDPNEINK